MRRIAIPVAAGLLAAAAIATPGALATRHHARAASATAPEVVGFGMQSGNPGGKKYARFGVFATGTGTAATGQVSFFGGSPIAWRTGNVTCMTISGNDAIITLQYKQAGVAHWAVAEAVDNSNPTDAVSPDAWRVSFDPVIQPTETPDCYTTTLGPVAILPSGGGADIRVETGP